MIPNKSNIPKMNFPIALRITSAIVLIPTSLNIFLKLCPIFDPATIFKITNATATINNNIIPITSATEPLLARIAIIELMVITDNKRHMMKYALSFPFKVVMTPAASTALASVPTAENTTDMPPPTIINTMKSPIQLTNVYTVRDSLSLNI